MLQTDIFKVNYMKKLFSIILSAVISVSFAACGSQPPAVQTAEYPLENQAVSQILKNRKFNLNTQLSFYDDSDTSGYTYTYSIDNTDETGNFVGELSMYGILQLEWGGEDGKSIQMVSMYDDSEFADITNYDNLRKSVLVACDVYGGIENPGQIADDFIAAVKKGDIFSEVLPTWNSAYNGVYVKAEFLPDRNGESFTFRSFEIFDQIRKDWYASRDQRALQLFVDMNPYMFTLEKLEHPPALTQQQVNDIIAGNQWGATATKVNSGSQTAGSERHLYEMRLADDTWIGSAGLFYNKSGKSTSFSFIPGNTDIHTTDSGVEFAVKTACRIYGDVEDIDGLAQKVKTALENKDFEYNQYNDPHCLIEHNGLYCTLNFSMKTPKVYEFTGLNLYNRNSLQAGIYSMVKTDNWHEKIYNRYFG